MKRFVQALLFVGAVLVAPLSSLATPVSAANVPYGETILSTGAKGAQVSALQSDLKELGYFTYKDVTGYYGSYTTAAVKSFQHAHHLTENGMVGMTTGPLIQQAVASKHTVVVASEENAAPAPLSAQPAKKFGVFQYDRLLSEYDSQAAAVADGVQWDHCSVRLMSDGTWVWSDYPAQGADAIISKAKQYLGTPYVWGGTQPGGFDCSGFVGYVFAQNNIHLPRTAHEMWNSGTPVGTPQPGDLVYFHTYNSGASHVGIYLGNGQFISATSSRGVRIASVHDSYWGPRYLGARHVL